MVNLLTLMPIKSYEELLSNVADLGKPENPEHEYNEMNMEVIAVLCKFLEKRLQEVRLAQASSSPDIDIHSLSFTRKLHPVLLSDCWAYWASCTRLPSLARRRESFCDTAFCRHCERPICSSDPKWATCRVIAWSVWWPPAMTPSVSWPSTLSGHCASQIETALWSTSATAMLPAIWLELGAWRERCLLLTLRTRMTVRRMSTSRMLTGRADWKALNTIGCCNNTLLSLN